MHRQSQRDYYAKNEKPESNTHVKMNISKKIYIDEKGKNKKSINANGNSK